jgi:CDP-diglyceride synthetase
MVYGVVVVGALLAGESGRHETYAGTIGAVLIATALSWLAHSYASVLGRRFAGGERVRAASLARTVVGEVGLLRGAAVPLLVLVVCWIAGLSENMGVTISIWSVVLALICFELLAGLRSRAAPAELALDVGVGVSMGLAILALKLILH